MARANLTQEDETLFEPRSGGARGALAEDDSPRILDLDPEEESPFLRAQRRVPVRRGPLAKKTANRLKVVLVALASVGVLVVCASVLYNYGEHSWRFRIRSASNIDVVGTQTVSRRQVMEAFAADLGRNIFSVPLEERRRRLEAIPWVESAAVMRLLPDRLRVDLVERTPMAFVRLGSRIALIDRNGVIMELPRSRKYSFPVIKGMADSEPLSTRAARMQMYSALMGELDSEGAHYSQDLSEVDLSDPEDAKVVVADPGGAVLIHLGSSDFLRRYKTYLAHLQEWRQQFQKVESVDLRYERQIIVNPDSGAHAASPHPVPAIPHKLVAKPAAAKPAGRSKAAATRSVKAKPAATAQAKTAKSAAPAPQSTAKPAETAQPATANSAAIAQPTTPKPATAQPAPSAQAKNPVRVRKPSPRMPKDTSTGTQ
jgi:cell division protein FtsQ